MEIARDRFLDDTRTYHLTLSLRSRTPATHSLMSALSSDERDVVAGVLARALDEIGRVVSARVGDQTTRTSAR
jgi:hypothetical protein